MQPLSVGDCIKFGWETFKTRPWILIGAFLLVVVISALPGVLGPHPQVGPDGHIIPQPLTAFRIIMGLVSVVVSILVSLGLTTFSLRAHDDIAGVQISDLWNPQPFWRYIGAHILSALIVIAGFILFFIPGVIASLGLGFVPFLVIDRGLMPVEALKESWRITKGHKWQLFLLVLAFLGLNILGLVALFVGIFVTVPITLLAFAHAYRTLAGRPAL